MLEGVQDPIRYHQHRVMLLEQMKSGACVGNHPLHHIVWRHKVPKIAPLVPQKSHFVRIRVVNNPVKDFGGIPLIFR